MMRQLQQQQVFDVGGLDDDDPGEWGAPRYSAASPEGDLSIEMAVSARPLLPAQRGDDCFSGAGVCACACVCVCV